MGLVQCCYFVGGSGKAYVKEFIDSLSVQTVRKFFFKIDLLEEFGKSLPQPHVKYVGEGIYELRFTGIEGKVRVLYFFFHKKYAIFTNGFIKKSERLPSRQLRTAIRRKSLFLNTSADVNEIKQVKRK